MTYFKSPLLHVEKKFTIKREITLVQQKIKPYKRTKLDMLYKLLD